MIKSNIRVFPVVNYNLDLSLQVSESSSLHHSLYTSLIAPLPPDRSTQGYMHMKIVRVDTQYILGQFSQPFRSIASMISHYTCNKLPIKGAEHMSLVYAVTAETL